MKNLTNSFESESNVSTVGRIVSSTMGVSLVTRCVRDLKHPSAKTWVALVIGAYLIYRSVTAFCPLSAAFETSPSKK